MTDYVRFASTRLYARPVLSDSDIAMSSTVAEPHDELQYLNLIRNVLDTGESRPDRTGTGTISLFAPPSLRFSLANSTLPLLTTKKTFLRGIIEELLWFINGQTDSTLLSKRGVKIWDGNGSKEFLEKRGLGHRRAGDLGPVYGFQWRHFGADYVDADTDYSGKGVDQLREVIRKIKEDPTDRRIILSAWNPAGLSLTFRCIQRVDRLSLHLQIYHLWLCHLVI
jgi:thymidylate synthase